MVAEQERACGTVEEETRRHDTCCQTEDGGERETILMTYLCRALWQYVQLHINVDVT